MTFVTVAGIVSAVAVAAVAFALFHIYSGVRDSLTNAKVGQIYNFHYEQPLKGDPERFMAKVLEVHTLSPESIRNLNSTSRYRRHDSNFHRTPHLVTAQTPDGKIRQFYAERSTNVRRPLLGRVAFKSGLASLLF